MARQGIASLHDAGEDGVDAVCALVVFVVLVLGAVVWIAKVPLKPFFKAVREPFTVAFATASSEAALPKAFENMERWACRAASWASCCPPATPSTSMARRCTLPWLRCSWRRPPRTTSGIHIGIGQQIVMMLVLMLTSKGVAAVPRASFVVLVAAVESFHLPVAGAFLILGIDALMDMARTSVNVLGQLPGLGGGGALGRRVR